MDNKYSIIYITFEDGRIYVEIFKSSYINIFVSIGFVFSVSNRVFSLSKFLFNIIEISNFFQKCTVVEGLMRAKPRC